MQEAGPEKVKKASLGIRMLSSLQIPGYRMYFLASLGQIASMVVGQVVSPVLIYHLTGSKALLGTVSLVSAIPMMIMSLLGGTIADRISKKHIMVFSYLGFALVSLGVGLCLQTGYLSQQHEGSWWILLVSSCIQGCLMGLMMPSLQAMVPELVKREQLMNASAVNMLGMNALNFIIPIITGAIIDRSGFTTVYYVISGLYIYGSIFIMMVPRTKPTVARRGKIIADIRDGLKYVRRNPTIWVILVFTTALVAFTMPFQQFMPVFAADILKVNTTWLGVLLGVSGAGALAGSIALMALPNRKRGLMLLVSGLVAGASLAAFSFSSMLGFSLAMMAVLGITMAFRGTISAALTQAYTEAPFMGRVMSLLNIQWGISAVCTFIVGIAATGWGVQWVVGGMAMLLFVISILTFAFSSRMRKVE